MRTERKTQTFDVKRTLPIPQRLVNRSQCGRNLKRHQLGGVIFGCTKNTMKECLSKQLFGLPARHFSYVKNIDPGLPLFLFNYSDKKLHGIFEASSKGKMFIDPYAWIDDDFSDETQYPAQVKVRVRLQCRPLSEDIFGQVIAENYYISNHFWFELDHRQTNKLMNLFTSAAIAPGTPVPRYNTKWRPVCESRQFCEMPKKDRYTSPMYTHQIKKVNDEEDEKNRIYKKLLELALCKKKKNLSLLDNVNNYDNPEAPPIRLLKKGENLNLLDDLYNIVQSTQQAKELEAFQKMESHENGHLEQKLMKASLEIQHVKDHCTMFECTNVEKTTIPSFQFENAIKFFQPMSSIGLYTSQVQLKVGGTTNGFECFTNVEMFNLDYGRWISVHSNLNKGFDFNGIKLNGSIHDNDEYNGFDYMKYTIGGFDEHKKVPYMELFDPCLEVRKELMNYVGDIYDSSN